MQKRLLVGVFCISLVLLLSISVVSAFTFSEWWGKITGFVAGDATSPIILTVSEGKIATTKIGDKAFNISAFFGTDPSSVILVVNNIKKGSFKTGNSLVMNNVNITVTNIVIKLSGVKYVTLKLFEMPVSSPSTVSKTSVTTTKGEDGTATTLICTDSDGGENPNVKGTINYDPSYGYSGIREDICNKDVPDSQWKNEESLAEGICKDDGSPLFKRIICPSTCQDGACIGETTTGTTTTTPPATTPSLTTPTVSPTTAPAFGEEAITFGETSLITSKTPAEKNMKKVSKFTLPQSGKVVKLSIQLSGGGSGRGLKGVIYSDNNGAPDKLLGTTDLVTISIAQTSPVWVDMTFASSISLNAGNYWLGFIKNDIGMEGLDYYRDLSINSPEEQLQLTIEKDDMFVDGASDPFGAGPPSGAGKLIAGRISIYATVTIQTIYVKNGKVGIRTDDPKAYLDIQGGGSGDELLRFSTDRAWVFKQSGSDSGAMLDLHSISPDKKFRITSEDGRVIFGVLVANGADKGIITLVQDGGKVAIGKDAPSETLDVDGNVKATGFIYSSDEKLKKNIYPIQNALNKIKQINGVSFEWKNDNKKSIGLIAQNVEKVFPEIVSVDEYTGLKSVEYGNLVALLIEAVKELNIQLVYLEELRKEQQNKIEKQQLQIQELRNEIEKLKNG